MMGKQSGQIQMVILDIDSMIPANQRENDIILFTEIALAIAFPKIAAWTHAPTVILLAFLRCPDVRVDGTILLLGDRDECDLGWILRVTKWEVAFFCHNFFFYWH